MPTVREPRASARRAGRRARRPARLAARALVLGLLALFAVSAAAAAQEEGRPRVLVATVDDPITPVIADYLGDGVARAEGDGYDAFVVRLDTPGGLEDSMRDIVQSFLDAEVPVVVYVSPQGARAASAGAIITFASHVAAMAPGTAIGAATPVDLEGGDVERKIVNDAAAFAESIARERGRDVDFAVATVREGRSAPASEALEIGAIDVISRSLPELLDDIDGREVELPGGRTVQITTAGATIDDEDMGIFRSIQQFLADPNLAFLFLSLGTLGIIYEFASPGIGVGGVLGAVFILMALFGLALLPVNAVGLLLLALAVALFVAELFAPGIGIAAAGGTVALLLSGVFLFDDAPGLEVSVAVVAPIAIVIGLAVILAGRLVLRTRKMESTAFGRGLLVGRTVTVRGVKDGRGQAFVEGAWWNVRSSGTALEEGEAQVVDLDGLDLVVEQQREQRTDNPKMGAS